MPYIKHEYFHKGVPNQTVPDIKITLVRPSKEEIKEWDEDNKKVVSEWLDKVSNVFEKFVGELRESIK